MSYRMVCTRTTAIRRPFSHSARALQDSPSTSTQISTESDSPRIFPVDPATAAKYIPSTFELHPLYDPDTHTISLPTGSIPASPIMSPAWRMTQGFFRAPKPHKQPPVGRFRKILSRNPYARMLASPLRLDPMTKALLPRELLAQFGVVEGPGGKPWWAPRVGEGPGFGGEEAEELEGKEKDVEGVEEVEQVLDAMEKAEEGELEGRDSGSIDDLEATEEANSLKDMINSLDITSDPTYIPTPRLPGAPPLAASSLEHPQSSSTSFAPSTPSTPSIPSTPPSPSATLTPNLRVYTHLSYSIINLLTTRSAGPHRNSSFLALRRANHQPWLAETPPIWRFGMPDVYLSLLQSRAVDDFILLSRPERLGKPSRTETEADLKAPPPTPFIPINSLEDLPNSIPPLVLRCALLSLNPLPASHPKTYTFPSVSYNGTIPIHDLPRLLGPTHLSHLISKVPQVSGTPWVMLVRPMTIHLRTRLWKLEGYLTEGNIGKDDKRGVQKKTDKKEVQVRVEEEEEEEEEEEKKKKKKKKQTIPKEEVIIEATVEQVVPQETLSVQSTKAEPTISIPPQLETSTIPTPTPAPTPIPTPTQRPKRSKPPRYPYTIY